jgi:predicted transcriptional regulator
MTTETQTIRVTMTADTVRQLDCFARQIHKRRSWVIEQLVLLASWESLVEAVEEGDV